VDPRPVSGTQHHLRAGHYEAVVASVGASLRSLTFQGRDLVVPYEADALRPAYRGATLAPWPNRVVDGRYRFGGAEHQLPLTEPGRGHALHGLVAWAEFDAVDHGDARVTLAATIEPQAGYPWRVVVESTYVLDAHGLVQVVRGTNTSRSEAPWGVGPHPYLVAGKGSLDSWELTLPADQVLDVTPDRLSPVRLHDVTAGDGSFDFRSARPIGDIRIDHAFTGLVRDSDGLAALRLTDASGSGVVVSWDAACPWLQVHTADLPDGSDAPGNRAGLAVEPMTCAPDAFNSDAYAHDTGLLILVPGGSASASWRIAALEPRSQGAAELVTA
jgi:aldose 1-epimerase